MSTFIALTAHSDDTPVFLRANTVVAVYTATVERALGLGSAPVKPPATVVATSNGNYHVTETAEEVFSHLDAAQEPTK